MKPKTKCLWCSFIEEITRLIFFKSLKHVEAEFVANEKLRKKLRRESIFHKLDYSLKSILYLIKTNYSLQQIFMIESEKCYNTSYWIFRTDRDTIGSMSSKNSKRNMNEFFDYSYLLQSVTEHIVLTLVLEVVLSNCFEFFFHSFLVHSGTLISLFSHKSTLTED